MATVCVRGRKKNSGQVFIKKQLRGPQVGILGEAHFEFVLDHVCLFILGVQGADLITQGNQRGYEKISVCL